MSKKPNAAELPKLAGKTVYAYVVVRSDSPPPSVGTLIIERRKLSTRNQVTMDTKTGAMGVVTTLYVGEGTIQAGKFVPAEVDKPAVEFIRRACQLMEANQPPADKPKPRRRGKARIRR